MTFVKNTIHCHKMFFKKKTSYSTYVNHKQLALARTSEAHLIAACLSSLVLSAFQPVFLESEKSSTEKALFAYA